MVGKPVFSPRDPRPVHQNHVKKRDFADVAKSSLRQCPESPRWAQAVSMGSPKERCRTREGRPEMLALLALQVEEVDLRR